MKYGTIEQVRVWPKELCNSETVGVHTQVHKCVCVQTESVYLHMHGHAHTHTHTNTEILSVSLHYICAWLLPSAVNNATTSCNSSVQSPKLAHFQIS